MNKALGCSSIERIIGNQYVTFRPMPIASGKNS